MSSQATSPAPTIHYSHAQLLAEVDRLTKSGAADPAADVTDPTKKQEGVKVPTDPASTPAARGVPDGGTTPSAAPITEVPGTLNPKPACEGTAIKPADGNAEDKTAGLAGKAASILNTIAQFTGGAKAAATEKPAAKKEKDAEAPGEKKPEDAKAKDKKPEDMKPADKAASEIPADWASLDPSALLKVAQLAISTEQGRDLVTQLARAELGAAQADALVKQASAQADAAERMDAYLRSEEGQLQTLLADNTIPDSVKQATVRGLQVHGNRLPELTAGWIKAAKDEGLDPDKDQKVAQNILLLQQFYQLGRMKAAMVGPSTNPETGDMPPEAAAPAPAEGASASPNISPEEILMVLQYLVQNQMIDEATAAQIVQQLDQGDSGATQAKEEESAKAAASVASELSSVS